ncbi:MAG TPA: hypothetical protein VFX23_01345 [Limnobacter sp.]|nr:hypothetical protein [Limnobacter sp.]
MTFVSAAALTSFKAVCALVAAVATVSLTLEAGFAAGFAAGFLAAGFAAAGFLAAGLAAGFEAGLAVFAAAGLAAALVAGFVAVVLAGFFGAGAFLTSASAVFCSGVTMLRTFRKKITSQLIPDFSSAEKYFVYSHSVMGFGLQISDISVHFGSRFAPPPCSFV